LDPLSYGDNCPDFTLHYTLLGVTTGTGLNSLDGQEFNTGYTTVRWTVTDLAGNTATCSFIVAVSDNESPDVLDCPAQIEVGNDPEYCGAVVNWTEPVAIDNCDGALTYDDRNHAPGAFFQIGTTQVLYTFLDAEGNQSLCIFNVIVSDNEVPVVEVCPIERSFSGCDLDAIMGPSFAAISTMSSYAVFSDQANMGIAADNCAIASVSYSDTFSGNCPIEVLRTWVLTDVAGNTQSCGQQILVVDAIAPEWIDADLFLDADCTENIQALSLDARGGRSLGPRARSARACSGKVEPSAVVSSTPSTACPAPRRLGLARTATRAPACSESRFRPRGKSCPGGPASTCCT
jgi:hypothetical protein